MTIYHFISEEETIERRLTRRLEECKQAVLASAFFTLGAFQALEPSLRHALRSGSNITFILGRFDYVTEPRAVDRLLNLSAKHPGHLQVYFDIDYGFHFKLALFKSASKPVVIIGSSNLTPKGLGSVGEVNLEIIGNQSVYTRARELLMDRLKSSELAKDAIEDYRVGYNRAQKYRQQRRRWDNRGKKAWSSRRNNPPYREPTGMSYPMCWFEEKEKDKTLSKHIKNEHRRAKTTGETFPNQWVHLELRKHAKLFKEGRPFVVYDGLSRNIGFAVCTKNVTVLDENDKRTPVIFYRYRRGWKRHFKSGKDLTRTQKAIGLGDRYTVGASVLTRLKVYLQRTHHNARGKQPQRTKVKS